MTACSFRLVAWAAIIVEFDIIGFRPISRTSKSRLDETRKSGRMPDRTPNRTLLDMIGSSVSPLVIFTWFSDCRVDWSSIHRSYKAVACPITTYGLSALHS